MCCLIALLGMIFPRAALVLVWLFDPPFINNAYPSIIVPILGLLFLPLTTLAYAFAFTLEGGPWNNGGGIIIMIIGLLFDLGCLGGGVHDQRDRSKSSR
jgi:hypothetical protein